MSTGPTTLPETGMPTVAAQRRLLPRLRDARIRSKLALILVVPVIAVLALAAVRLIDVGRSARDADLVRSLTGLSADVSELTHQMHKERMAAATYLATPAAPANPYTVQVGATDQRITAYTSARQAVTGLPGDVEVRLRRIDDHLNALNGTRREVLDRQQMAVDEAVLRYGVVITDLVAYGDALGQLAGDNDIADSLRAMAAFSRAKAATAEEEAVAFAALSGGPISDEQYSAFVATLTGQQEALMVFSLAASPTQQSVVNSTVTGDAVILADQTATRISRSVGRRTGIGAGDAARSIGAVTDLMRWAETRLEQNLQADAEATSSSVTRQAIIETILVLLTLVLAIALAVVLARSLNRSLRRLREGALSVANRDLPDAVARLRDVRSLGEGAAEDIVRQVRDPIRLTNRDEIGQVAQAFNAVHREAVRIAAEQAALRTSVSAMFLNLARRSQSLVDRMIGELDQIERGEEDPKRLAQLFELDHLATRMRRNDENLLVLAGADSSPPRREDALLIDALRAAQSEVELYNRIEFGTIDTDISITANAVNDVVRLIAELLDNATRFSPPTTVVVADARRVGDHVVVQIEDRGLGMSPEQLASVNRRLAQPQTVDAGAFRLMGLAVVGRLAARYGIRVELCANGEGGTLAQATLPSAIVVLPRVRPREVGSRPRTPLAVEPRPSLTAAAAGRPDPMAPAMAGAAPAESWATQRDAWPAVAGSRTDGQLPGRAGRPAAPPAVAQPAADGWGAGAPVTASGSALSASLGTPTVAYPTVQPAAPSTGRPAPEGAVIPATVHPLAPTGYPPAAPTRADGPTQPPLPANGRAVQPATPAPERRIDDRSEAPIFRAMEAVWFRSHDDTGTADWGMPTAGYAPPPVSTAGPVAGGMPTGPVAGSANVGAYGSAVIPDGFRSTATSSTDVATAVMPTVPMRSGWGTGGGRPVAATDETVGERSTAATGNGSGSDGPFSGGPAGPGSGDSGSGGPASGGPASGGPASGGSGSGGRGSGGSAAGGSGSGGWGTGGAHPGGSGSGGSTAGEAHFGGSAGGWAANGNGAGVDDATAARPAVPRPRTPVEDSWRTAADEGWSRASAAADPTTAGTTRSGLPRRVPQAQLVPGGIEARPGDQTLRTPEKVRGLLSAYHRGVQRGRSAGSAEAAAGSPPPPSEEPDK